MIFAWQVTLVKYMKSMHVPMANCKYSETLDCLGRGTINRFPSKQTLLESQ